jgi:hypothetical protein
MKGMIETIRAVATASAGASISQPAGTTMFQVVSNTEAGGWTVDSSTTSPSNSYTNWGGSIQINAPTNKTGYQKSFKIATNSTSSQQSYSGALICKFKAYDGTSARYEGNLSYSNSSGSTTNFTQWMPTNGIYQTSLTWHFSCTADYAYLWFEHDGSRSSYHNNFAGVSELQNVPASYLGTGNAFFPAVGFYSSSLNTTNAFGTTTTSYYNDFFAHSIHGSYPNGDDGPFDYVNANNIYYTGQGQLTGNDSPMQLGPQYYYNNSTSYSTTYNYKPIFNADGNKVGALVPAMYFNPYRGIPFTTLAGFFYYEPFERAVGSEASLPSITRQSEIIYDDSGAKYTLQYQPSHFGIRAFRSE